MNEKDLSDIISFAERNNLIRLPFMTVFYAYKSINNKYEAKREN